jgi:hypothetical protein
MGERKAKWQVLEMRAANVLCNPAEYGDNEAAKALGEDAAEHADSGRGKALVEIGGGSRLCYKYVEECSGESVRHATPAKVVQLLRPVSEEKA